MADVETQPTSVCDIVAAWEIFHQYDFNGLQSPQNYSNHPFIFYGLFPVRVAEGAEAFPSYFG